MEVGVAKVVFTERDGHDKGAKASAERLVKESHELMARVQHLIRTSQSMQVSVQSRRRHHPVT
jgi:hypothetical protein